VSNAELLAMLKDERAIAAEERRKPPLACPYDGSPLEFRDGVYHCPFGDYTTRRTTREDP